LFLIQKKKLLQSMATAGLSFHRAATQGDLNRMRFLLRENKVAVNKRDPFGYTALHWAAQSGQLDAIHVLLEHGADVSAICAYDQSCALHSAVVGKSSKCAAALIGAGAPRLHRNNQGKTAVQLAAEMQLDDVVEALASTDSTSSSSSSNVFDNRQFVVEYFPGSSERAAQKQSERKQVCVAAAVVAVPETVPATICNRANTAISPSHSRASGSNDRSSADDQRRRRLDERERQLNERERQLDERERKLCQIAVQLKQLQRESQ
jgi:ankyrin repeat protein